MDIKDIKEGETYNVRVKVIGKYGKCIDAIYADADDAIVGLHIPERRVGVLRPISPENGIKNTEPSPKYDPNRLFRKGDKVRVVERHGRYQPNIPWDELWKGLCTVAEDENFCNNLVKVRSEDGREKLSHWWYLELVTPVEELEPYIVVDAHTHWDVADKNMKTVAMYSKGNHPNAKEAAEAERDRLNAEHRKEQQ